jgi:hypothetical protein
MCLAYRYPWRAMMLELSSDGSPVALGSTGTHEARVKLVNPHRGATPLAEIQVFTNTIKYR